jgi:hypothetical protein
MKTSVDEKVNSFFENREAEIDCSEVAANITAYFEDYAHEAHVIKDETYEKKLVESIIYAQKTALNEADVYSFDVMKRAGITDKIARAMELARKYKYACIGALAVLFIILILLKRLVYWIGTALFSAGVLMIIPSAIVEANSMIQKFSLKDFTTYTLITGTMESLVGIVLKAGIILAAIGLCFITFHCVCSYRGETAKRTEIEV